MTGGDDFREYTAQRERSVEGKHLPVERVEQLQKPFRS
jgi:hypothetical protein